GPGSPPVVRPHGGDGEAHPSAVATARDRSTGGRDGEWFNPACHVLLCAFEHCSSLEGRALGHPDQETDGIRADRKRFRCEHPRAAGAVTAHMQHVIARRDIPDEKTAV